MDEMSKTQTETAGDSVRLWAHDDCDACPEAVGAMGHLSHVNRTVVDAIGDIHLILLRNENKLGLWDAQVRVYSVDADPDAGWDLEHWGTAGVPKYMPPNCPEWLWLMYTVLGDMCSHFMDLHDVTVNSEAHIAAQRAQATD